MTPKPAHLVLRALALVVLVGGLASPALAAEADPPDHEEYFKLGNDYYAGKLYDKAVEAYEKCVALNPQYKEAWYNLGIAYSRVQQFRKEIDAYKKAIDADPRYEKALYNLSLIHI